MIPLVLIKPLLITMGVAALIITAYVGVARWKAGVREEIATQYEVRDLKRGIEDAAAVERFRADQDNRRAADLEALRADIAAINANVARSRTTVIERIRGGELQDRGLGPIREATMVEIGRLEEQRISEEAAR